MIIPKGYTESEVLDIIELVSNRMCSRYTFGYYEEDDIKQECFLMANDALERYDGRAPLENFLSVHISNRLKTFIRDNYYRKSYTCTACGESYCEDCEQCLKRERNNINKRNLMDTIDIDIVNIDGERNAYYDDIGFELIEASELERKVRQELPANMQEDYIKIMSDVYVTKDRRNEILDKVKEIVCGS